MSRENGTYFLDYVKNSVFDFAHDSYRVPVLNTGLRIHELFTEIQKTPSHYIEKSIAPIIKEIDFSIQKDLAFNEVFEKSLPDIKSDLKSGNIGRIKTMASITLGDMADFYVPKNVELLKNEMSKKLRKEKVNYYANNIVSQFLSDGYSKRFVRDAIKNCRHLKGEDVDGPKIIDEFMSNFTGAVKNYRCCAFVSKHFAFYLKGIVGFEVYENTSEFKRKFGKTVDLIDEEWIRKGNSYIKNQKGKRKYLMCIVVASGIKAQDQYSAQEEFESRLNQIRSIAYASGNEPSLSWSNRFSIYDESNNWVFRSENNVLNKRYYLQEQVREKYFRNFVRAIGAGMRENNTRVLRCFSAASTAFRVKNKESQLVSLWSSLETMLPDKNDQKISNINHYMNYMIPLIMIQYLNRVMSWIYFDITKMKQAKVSEVWKSLDGDSDFHRFCAMIVCGQNDDMLRKLFSEIENEVLKFRLYFIYKNLSNISDVIKYIDRHEMLVSWQIMRIYRRRNGIVHNGYGDVEENLLLNFNEYWLNVMRRTSNILARYKCRSELDDVFKIGVQQYKQYRSYLTRREKELNNQRGSLSLVPSDVAYIFSP